MGYFFPLSSDTRSAVFLRTGAAQPGRGRCVDSLSLLMEKAHNVSSVHRLTLEASQRRTKLSQSSCPPWVSGLSSGFIKLLRKGTHRGRLSRKSCGGLAQCPPAVTAEKVSIVPCLCQRVWGYLWGPWSRSGRWSRLKGTDWGHLEELHTVVRSPRRPGVGTQQPAGLHLLPARLALSHWG